MKSCKSFIHSRVTKDQQDQTEAKVQLESQVLMDHEDLRVMTDPLDCQ